MASPSLTPLKEKTTTPPARSGVPLLHPGDRLSRAEFERRYLAQPDIKKAELIEGVVYMPSAHAAYLAQCQAQQAAGNSS